MQTILGIETSCDETAAAVVRGNQVLSSIIYSQVPLHQPYGGVVPEIASRSHVEKLPGVVAQALNDAHISYRDLDAVAVTYGPGLASSLVVGLSFAKGLSVAINRPLIGINHIAAHLYSVFLSPDAPPYNTAVPLLALIVSGGHSCLVDVQRPGKFKVIGQTIDDAAGEAFDKAAQLLKLGYPGGPAIDKAARKATHADVITFPQGRTNPDNPILGGLRADLCFSFSGLKTALMYQLRTQPAKDEDEVNNLAAAYQEAIVTALAERCRKALANGKHRFLAAGGGVSLNSSLRARLKQVAEKHGVSLLLAEPRFCGDNAAMIAALATTGAGVRGDAALSLDVVPNLPLE